MLLKIIILAVLIFGAFWLGRLYQYWLTWREMATLHRRFEEVQESYRALVEAKDSLAREMGHSGARTALSVVPGRGARLPS